MLLRNGKMICVDQDLGNLTTHNISYIYYWYISKGEYPPNKNIKLIVRCVCDLLYKSFIIQFKRYYGKKAKVVFEADYSFSRNIYGNHHEYTQKHINNIEHLVNVFIASSYFRGEYKRVYYKDAFVVILAISYYYFQMVVIETLYNDCLLWSIIKHTFCDEEYCSITVRQENQTLIDLSTQLYITLWKDFAFSDDHTCAYIRQFVLKMA